MTVTGDGVFDERERGRKRRVKYVRLALLIYYYYVKVGALAICTGILMGFGEATDVDACGTSGGLWVGWKREAKMSLVNICNHFVVLLVEKYNGSLWYLVLFYDAPDLASRNSVFVELEDVLGSLTKGESRVYERLDKALGSKNWFSVFPDTGLKHYPIQISDHAPIEVDLNLIKNPSKKPYRMDAWALEYSECIQTIRKAWFIHDRGSPTFCVARKLARVRGMVKRWTLDKRNEWNGKWEDFDKKLEHGMEVAITEGNDEEYTRVNEEVRDFAIVTLVWKQRAKIKWMVDGDTCTKYFFNWVKGRAGRNFILGVKNEDGSWCYDLWARKMQKVMKYLVGEYQNAFIAGRSITDNILVVHEAIHKINMHKTGKRGMIAFKADMSKAYDRVK
ncbi:uncharacterized protein LOC141639477 [Silene latifolia]|uniref:uncharacterized protein LOC141639477 n=1 Tax=Silene latifolia TaxID=37657 RepID=UPI003D784943